METTFRPMFLRMISRDCHRGIPTNSRDRFGIILIDSHFANRHFLGHRQVVCDALTRRLSAAIRTLTLRACAVGR